MGNRKEEEEREPGAVLPEFVISHFTFFLFPLFSRPGTCYTLGIVAEYQAKGVKVGR